MNEVFTPKEYAEWLVNKLSKHIVNWNDGGFKEDFTEAKQCALITINEIIMSTRMLVDHYVRSYGTKAYIDIELSKNLTLEYYKEVKKEIEKL
jgi:hypothetical protein